MGNYGWPQIKAYITLQILETPISQKMSGIWQMEAHPTNSQVIYAVKENTSTTSFINLPTTEAVLQSIVMAGQVRILGMNKNEQKLQLAPPHQTRL